MSESISIAEVGNTNNETETPLNSFESSAKKEFFPDIPKEKWEDAQWQKENTIGCWNPHSKTARTRFATQIKKIFSSHLSKDDINIIIQASSERKVAITPYEISLVQIGNDGMIDTADPVWQQFMPVEGDNEPDILPENYGSNWERAEEAVAGGIAHHKYPDRVIVRLCHFCPGTCSFCFERRNTLEGVEEKFEKISKQPSSQLEELYKLSAKIGAIPFDRLGVSRLGNIIITPESPVDITPEELSTIWRHWKELTDLYLKSQVFTENSAKDLLDYLDNNPRAREVKEIIFSGGEPLLRLRQLTEIAKAVKQRGYKTRVHTRALTHNPFMINQEMARELGKIVDVMNIHINHPNEITEEFKERVRWLQSAGIIVQNQHVFLGGVSDDLETQKKLFIAMDELGISMHHLFHAMCGEVPKHFRPSIEKFILVAKQLIDWREQQKGREWAIKDDSGNDIDGDFVIPHPEGKNYVFVDQIKAGDFSSDDPNNWLKQFRINFITKGDERYLTYPYTHKTYDENLHIWIEATDIINYPYPGKNDWQESYKDLKQENK